MPMSHRSLLRKLHRVTCWRGMRKYADCHCCPLLINILIAWLSSWCNRFYNFWVIDLEKVATSSFMLLQVTYFLFSPPPTTACSAIPLPWITGVQFALHSCEPFSAESGLKSAVCWHWRADPGSGKIATLGSGSIHMPGPVHGSASQRVAEHLSRLLPHPPQPSAPVSKKAEQRAVTDSQQLSTRGAVRTERSLDHQGKKA